ncbi:unnamed protein product, partial [Nesidiocoris tenuis]
MELFSARAPPSCLPSAPSWIYLYIRTLASADAYSAGKRRRQCLPSGFAVSAFTNQRYSLHF